MTMDSPIELPEGERGRPIPFGVALVPIVVLLGLLALVILILPRTNPGFSGSGHLPLLLAAAAAGLLARGYGWRWSALQIGMLRAIHLSMGAILILTLIGALIGVWIAAGIVPAFISWGLALLRPSFFLAATCAICSIVSLVTGSSWSTAGTVGLALIGVGDALAVDPAMTAGAVISGAYFGDKLSPLSDTTNLAPAMAGAELFTHIRHMLWSTIPSWLIALVGFTLLSRLLSLSGETESAKVYREVLEQTFRPGIWHAVVPITVFALAMRRLPALPVLFLGTLLAGALAVGRGAPLAGVLSAAMDGYHSSTGNAALDALLSRGGLMSMMNTVLLILSAMVFGGTMEVTGMLETIASRFLSIARGDGSLIVATVLTTIATNILTADQFIALILPGRMYAPAFARRGLHPVNLSRALEDGGTMTSVLIPWNTCGAFMSATLGVPTARYFRFCFLNLVNPFVAMAYALGGLTIYRLNDGEQRENS